MIGNEEIELKEAVEENVEQKEVVEAIPKNILTKAGLIKLPMKHQTSDGKKLRVYKLDLNWELDMLAQGSATLGASVLVRLFGCAPCFALVAQAKSKPLVSAIKKKNMQIMADIQTALTLEHLKKGRIITPNTTVKNLLNKNHLLVKKGNSLSIMTKRNYDGIRKYGRLSIQELSYQGEYRCEPPILDGIGTITKGRGTLKGLWVNNSIDPSYAASEYVLPNSFNFTGKISCSPFEDLEKVEIIYLAGKLTCWSGNYYEGEYSNGLPHGRGEFVIDKVPFKGSVTTTVINHSDKLKGYEYTIKPDDQSADEVVFSQEYYFSNIEIKKRIPKAIPSVGEEFQPVLSRALTLSQYLKAQRQTIIFVFNDTPCIMQRSFCKSGWGSYYIDPPLSIPPGCYASFHHGSEGGASQGFFSYQLNCPESPLQVKCGFDTQFLFRTKNRFGGELLLRAQDGELPNGDGDEKILRNNVEKETHDARVMEKDRHSGIEMHLGMNNDRTSFFCVRVQQYDPHNVTELKIPAKKEIVDRLVLNPNELKESENINFFFKR